MGVHKFMASVHRLASENEIYPGFLDRGDA
jgi:hypothetical protein